MALSHSRIEASHWIRVPCFGKDFSVQGGSDDDHGGEQDDDDQDDDHDDADDHDDDGDAGNFTLFALCKFETHFFAFF